MIGKRLTKPQNGQSGQKTDPPTGTLTRRTENDNAEQKTFPPISKLALGATHRQENEP